MHEISVTELSGRRERGDELVVLDVRDPDEIEIAALSGTLDIPMPEIPQRLGEIPRESEIVVLCHTGRRSAHVAQFLAQNGFARVANVRGGIDAWSREVDPTVTRY